MYRVQVFGLGLMIRAKPYPRSSGEVSDTFAQALAIPDVDADASDDEDEAMRLPKP